MSGSTWVILLTATTPCSAPLSYTPVRSIYSPSVRAEQTLETIESVRKYIPEAKIILVEGSQTTDKLMAPLIESVDKFIPAYEDAVIRKYVDSPHKALAEAALTCIALGELLTSSATYVYKLSSRYVLSREFLAIDAQSDEVVIKPCRSIFDQYKIALRLDEAQSINTSLFGMPPCLIPALMEYLSLPSIREHIEKSGISYERIMRTFFANVAYSNIRTVPVLGVVGRLGVSDRTWNQ